MKYDFIYPAVLPLNTGVSVKIFYLNKMWAKVCVTELLVYLSFIF